MLLLIQVANSTESLPIRMAGALALIRYAKINGIKYRP